MKLPGIPGVNRVKSALGNLAKRKGKDAALRLLNVQTMGLSGLLLDSGNDEGKQYEVLVEYIEDLAADYVEERDKRRELEQRVTELEKRLSALESATGPRVPIQPRRIGSTSEF